MRPTPALMISVTSPFPGTLFLSRTDADRVPPSPLPPVTDHRYQIPQVVIIVIVVLVSAFLLITCYVAFVKHCSSWTQVLNRSNRSPPASDHQRSDELVRNHRGDQNPSVDHPFWLITSVGLQQSVIDSIAVIRFKRGEDLTEGTDCSVCLVEFQEGEHLRLLPKCNHAFHIDCIDTWLSSHTNCPLCRQGVVVSSDGPSLGQNEPRFRQVRWAELPRLEDSDSNSSDVDVGNTQARSPNRADTEHSYEIDNNNNNNNSNNNDKRKVEDGKSIIIMNRERRCFSMDVVDGSNSCNVDYDMSQGDANSSSFGLTASSSSWRSHPAKKRSYSWSEKVH